MDLVIGGGQVGGGEVGSGDGWGTEGGFFHTFEQKSSHCIFIEVGELTGFAY